MPATTYTLWQYGDEPMRHAYRDDNGLEAFTIAIVSQDPNKIVRITREAPWTEQHETIMGPANSFLYLGADDHPGYVVYGNGTIHISMNFFLRPGKKENSTAQNGKDYKWKIVNSHRMECVDGRTTLAIWEITSPTHEAFARLELHPSSLTFITEILTSLTLNRIAQAQGW
ncbi:hypothetical protein CC1G_07880 [Coprinopsis cinerea okayama7|uniref:Uncharacterized protein n=1 Tax=Coprinopsis cinerea (strain Okayama-7 / 130 / ATCC MYA-4618 / FGSC 9003) TaxID=240176 RepID=A8P6J6_COPC7|nr:hypothetical protein CC1G_07880 [Coprinopsis cinerea okayama7\|eukprot:XP_001839165.1 hypothetical protein CC1G_07880 [Coprinopsis cinerea okayama7\